MNRIRVLHITDSLDAGGMERTAVNLTNCLPRERYQLYFCTTRHAGVLADLLEADVTRLCLHREVRFDIRAIRVLQCFIREHAIQVLHAHGSSVFIAALVARFAPRPAVIWHDNYGGHGVVERPAWLYGIVARRLQGIIAASRQLEAWSQDRLGVPADRVEYIPNSITKALPDRPPSNLPGPAGHRIICVANFRPQKDHFTLLRALSIVIRSVPAAQLLLVGCVGDPRYYLQIQSLIVEYGLSRHVSLLGQRLDVPDLLRACDIGVLSSAGEGLPLALLEFGMAGLPAIATRVGQCAEVLEDGEAGLLVPPNSPEALAAALLHLLESRERRADLAERLHSRVQKDFSVDAVIDRICRIYDRVAGLDTRQDESPNAIEAPRLSAFPTPEVSQARQSRGPR